jgi:hypothetical protein
MVFKFSIVYPVQLGTTLYPRLLLLGINQEVVGEDFSSEVAAVKAFTYDGFVYLLCLLKGKGVG